ncbi:hypothetical protein D3C74_324970 [compost metagenome]
MRGLLFGLPGACGAVEVGGRVAAVEGLTHEDVDRDAVLGVHHDHRAVGRGLLHGPQDLAVVAVEHPGVGHEELEARDALGHELVHGLERVVVDPAEDLVEPVVHGAVPLGLGEPGGERVLDPLPGALDREVDDRRRASPGRGARPGLERVRGGRAAERQLHVGVRVHRARDHVLAGRVDHRLRDRGEVHAERRVARAHERGDLLAVEQDVGARAPRGPDDGATRDEGQCHGAVLSFLGRSSVRGPAPS